MVAAKVLIIGSEVSGFYFLPSISGKKSIKVTAWRCAEGALYAGTYMGGDSRILSLERGPWKDSVSAKLDKQQPFHEENCWAYVCMYNLYKHICDYF